MTDEQSKMMEVLDDIRNDILAGVVSTLAIVSIQPETGEACTKTAYIYDNRTNMIHLIGALELLKVKATNRVLTVVFASDQPGFESGDDEE